MKLWKEKKNRMYFLSKSKTKLSFCQNHEKCMLGDRHWLLSIASKAIFVKGGRENVGLTINWPLFCKPKYNPYPKAKDKSV